MSTLRSTLKRTFYKPGLYLFLSTTLCLSAADVSLADKTNPDFVPPEITLPYPPSVQQQASQQTTAGQAVPGQASGQMVPGQTGGSAQGYPGFQIPGQMNAMVNQAAQQANTPGLSGGMNPFLMKAADRLRQAPGTQIPTKGYAPPGGPGVSGNLGAGTPGAAGQGAPSQLQQAQQQQAQGAPPAQLSTQVRMADPSAVIATSKGNITIMLFKEYAPKNVAAFSEMVRSGFYNGLTFHRVEPGFVIQGGCPNGNGTGNYIPPGSNQPRFLPLEASPKVSHNAAGVVAMARQPGNPNSASCQFYITLKPSLRLDGQYTIFGGVTSGMDVVNNIRIGDRINSITVSE